MTHVILDTSVPFNWNGILVRFNEWAADAFGIYEYRTRDRRHHVRYKLRPAGSAVEIVILAVDNQTPRRRGTGARPGTHIRDGEMLVTISQGISVRTVPEALLMFVLWAEGAGFSRG